MCRHRKLHAKCRCLDGSSMVNSTRGRWLTCSPSISQPYLRIDILQVTHACDVLGSPVKEAGGARWHTFEGLVAERGAPILRNHLRNDSSHSTRPLCPKDVCLIAHGRHLTLVTCSHMGAPALVTLRVVVGHLISPRRCNICFFCLYACWHRPFQVTF